MKTPAPLIAARHALSAAQMKQNSSREVLLIIPELPSSSWLNSSVAGVTQPLGAAYLASYLRRGGFTVTIIDNCVERLTPAGLAERAAELGPLLIGLTATTTNFNIMLRHAAALKSRLPGVPLIAGGQHASALPARTLDSGPFDAVVAGEGEETLLELARKFAEGAGPEGVKGAHYRSGGEIRSNPPRPPIADLDLLPLPAYDLLPMGAYHPSLSRRFTAGPSGSLITARGCAYKCSFCSKSVFSNGIRLRSAESVIAEARLLKEKYGATELIVWDDAFTTDRERALEIARGFRKATGLPWSCYTRTDHASDALYAEFAAAGCREMLFGAESGCDAVLAGVNKQLTSRDTENAVTLARKHGISSFCSVILGLPGDTPATINETVDFLVRINPDYAAFCVLIPFPGSELFELAVKKELLRPETADWDSFVTIFSSKLPPVSLCALTPVELMRAQKRAFRRFFLRPAYFGGRVKRAFRDGLVHRAVSFGKGALTLLKHQLHDFGGGPR